MATHHPWPRRVPGLSVGLFFFAICRLSAVQLSISVGSQVEGGCRSVIDSSSIRKAMETQLQDAGYQIGRIHSSRFGSDLDCVPVNSDHVSARTVIHQCLSLTQAVSVPAQARSTLASTWRQCQSYTCAERACQTAALSTTRQLVEEFIAENRPTVKREAIAAQPAIASPIHSPVSSDTRSLFYCFYIVACIAVLFRWEWCKYQY